MWAQPREVGTLANLHPVAKEAEGDRIIQVIDQHEGHLVRDRCTAPTLRLMTPRLAPFTISSSVRGLPQAQCRRLRSPFATRPRPMPTRPSRRPPLARAIGSLAPSSRSATSATRGGPRTGCRHRVRHHPLADPRCSTVRPAAATVAAAKAGTLAAATAAVTTSRVL